MLSNLSLRDLAVASRVDLSLASGMSVITGETGAGKSILVDALSLLAGGRADSGVVRQGSERGEASAEWDIAAVPAAAAWLKEHELDDEGQCLLRRVVRADGGSRAFINGRPASLQQLRELAGLLIEIHGQHEHQALLDRGHQLGLLDQYAKNEVECEAVTTLARRWREIRAREEALRAAHAVGADEIALLEAQLAALDQADTEPARIEALEQEHRRLSHAGELLEGLGRLEAMLEDDEGASARRALGLAAHESARLAHYDHELGEASALLENAQVQVDEALSVLRRRREAVDLDPERLAQAEADLGRLHALARKHRVPMSELAAVRAALATRLDEAASAGTRLQALDRERIEVEAAWSKAAAALRQSREQAARTLGQEVSTLMHRLGMGGGHFEVRIDPIDGDPQAGGSEQVEFLVSANAGMAPRPLRKVASGGELARISLAIKVATIALDDTPTLVFDEVDSGIGGAIAEIVGRTLHALGARRQVLCVTHLAQVAACADQHYRVEKQVRGGRSESQVSALGDEARIAELARMQGGVEITPATLAAAADLRERLGKKP
jgi:DNA repair protein RecN (Recombination protein N)